MIKNCITDIDELEFKWSNITDFNKLNLLNKYENEIAELNNLLGEREEFINDKLIEIVKDNNKQIIDILLLLIAVRPLKLKDICITSPYSNGEKYSKLYENNNFNELIYFFNESGLKELFTIGFVKNLKDYLLGIEIGLDSNSRKNRSGKLMEEECEKIIKSYCNDNNLIYYKQKQISTSSINKKFDFVIEINKKLYVIEVNNYNSSGSKIKSVSEEYIALNEALKKENITFIWITNGKGWISSKKQFDENLLKIEHFLNFKMLKDNYLNIFLK